MRVTLSMLQIKTTYVNFITSRWCNIKYMELHITCANHVLRLHIIHMRQLINHTMLVPLLINFLCLFLLF